MYLVAIAELAQSLEAPQLATLAADIGTTAYELRLLLNAGLPAVVLATADADQAKSVAAAIARQGHVSISCDRRGVVPSASMTLLRNFEFTKAELVADRGSTELCPYDDIAVLLRATHRTTTESVQQVKERKLRPVAAVLTGGLILSKTTTKEVTTTSAQREQVLYIFRKSQHKPWLLRERSANYATLGAAMGPASFENFTTTITQLRERARDAAYDERLLASRPIRGVADGIEAMDLLADLWARYLRSS
jgi:hypothetical protein